jgi:hypothetical protein
VGNAMWGPHVAHSMQYNTGPMHNYTVVGTISDFQSETQCRSTQEGIEIIQPICPRSTTWLLKCHLLEGDFGGAFWGLGGSCFCKCPNHPTIPVY